MRQPTLTGLSFACLLERSRFTKSKVDCELGICLAERDARGPPIQDPGGLRLTYSLTVKVKIGIPPIPPAAGEAEYPYLTIITLQ